MRKVAGYISESREMNLERGTAKLETVSSSLLVNFLEIYHQIPEMSNGRVSCKIQISNFS